MPNEILSRYLFNLAKPGPLMGHWNLNMAEHLLANPQAHVDALVEAGVLKKQWNMGYEENKWYIVVKPEPPHTHVWQFEGAGEYWCNLICQCGEHRYLEVP
jgi:hypothetical protein